METTDKLCACPGRFQPFPTFKPLFDTSIDVYLIDLVPAHSCFAKGFAQAPPFRKYSQKLVDAPVPAR